MATNQQSDTQLEQGTYEILRGRLRHHANDLATRLEQLNQARRTVFGSIETTLAATHHVTTDNSCVPRDIVAIGNVVLFGYNVHFGLKSETQLHDVFAAYSVDEEHLASQPLNLLDDSRFQEDFHQLYHYYRHTTFASFFRTGPFLHFVFRVGKSANDIKSFKWRVEENKLIYVDSRSDHEVRLPPQHDFEWIRTHRDLHRYGTHPHIAIEDRLFVETIGGDLTVKIEDNTEFGEGIYSEPVREADQTLDDADIYYAVVDHLILLKIKPYQETEYRYLVYSEKQQEVTRIDSIAQACVALPQGHGLIFADGYLLQTGEQKRFGTNIEDLQFLRRLSASNGEDFLYVFFHAMRGEYVLLSYNVIAQTVATPMVCHGYCMFPDGTLLNFKAHDEPRKHHAIQTWTTPFSTISKESAEHRDSLLYKIGNQELVRGMAECHEIYSLCQRDDSYAHLYVDLVGKTSDVLDGYFWIGDEGASSLATPLEAIGSAASAAVDEFDTVSRLRSESHDRTVAAKVELDQLVRKIASSRFEHIDDYVSTLAALRHLRGQVITLRELRYIDMDEVDQIEQSVVEQSDAISHRCVEFLLDEEALGPFADTVHDHADQVPQVDTVAAATRLETEIDTTSQTLDMLIDTVSSLAIEDATHRTRIIENISTIYAHLNQVRATLKKRQEGLQREEGEAEFHSQTRLLDQALINYLGVCDTPERCDEYLTKMMVQVEELEGRFAEFDTFLLELTTKREQIVSAFDGRRVALIEARSKRAVAITSAGERILKGVETRVRNLSDAAEIHAFFAADLMIEKLRGLIAELAALGDTVRVDDLQSRLKTAREDAVRQWKDRHDLYVDGTAAIQLGRHQFLVNSQPLDVTTVVRNDRLCLHLTGTNYLEPIDDESIDVAPSIRDQIIVSETPEVYRVEYLVYQILYGPDRTHFPRLSHYRLSDEEIRRGEIRAFMASRHEESYVKGVHDHDAERLLTAILQQRSAIGLLRFTPAARALGEFAWSWSSDETTRRDIAEITPRLQTVRHIAQMMSVHGEEDAMVDRLFRLITSAAEASGCFSPALAPESAEFLLEHGIGPPTGPAFPLSTQASQLMDAFHKYLVSNGRWDPFCAEQRQYIDQGLSPAVRLDTLQSWLRCFVAEHAPDDAAWVDEAAVAMLSDTRGSRPVLSGNDHDVVDGMLGDHARVANGSYHLSIADFSRRLRHHCHHVVPAFRSYAERKHQLVVAAKQELRIDEFRPRVLTSFVRNQLIDQVYLPLIGDNLAKQIGVAGESKRTDLMGLLLLVSPPGYGKTTLMEYVANRLGLTFMKVNGPSIGHQVTSLDPGAAGNASARQEIEKLNLALRMGDNVMIYIDDIQHCHPEFLQKFIPLCDAQRQMEGVWQGIAKTYDLRGRKVVVVMAGNPYTESGHRFQVPDMLANRADTYNLGDMLTGYADMFRASYLENAMTSNAVLAPLAQQRVDDIRTILQAAEKGSTESMQLEGRFEAGQLSDFLSVMRKMIRAREIVIKVNREYIRSAAQADAYRTEPPFKLQGSYRDMNKIAERIVPVMNDDELDALVDSHYENQAQTLTSGAESNLLKLKEMRGTLSSTETERWSHICRTFQRNLLLGGDDADRTTQLLAQLSVTGEALQQIHQVLSDRLATSSNGSMARLCEHLESIQDTLETTSAHVTAHPTREVAISYKVPRAFLDVIRSQVFSHAKLGPATRGGGWYPATGRCVAIPRRRRTETVPTADSKTRISRPKYRNDRR